MIARADRRSQFAICYLLFVITIRREPIVLAIPSLEYLFAL
jgi:hypothetical protein